MAVVQRLSRACAIASGARILARVQNDVSFDDAAIARLRLAAEEVAWLTGRGYPLAVVSDLVANHRSLTAGEQSALTCGTCSEPQYMRRAARELEAEDIARRPLAIDAANVIASIEAALAGRFLLETLDGTVRAFGIDDKAYTPGAQADEAIELLFRHAKDLKPSVLRFFVEERASSTSDLERRIQERAKSQKLKVEVMRVGSVFAALRKEKALVSGDAAVLDSAPAWFNLAGRVVSSIRSAKVVRLQ